MDRDGYSPPFWPPPSAAFHHRRRRSPSPIFNPVLLILLLPILALLLLFFVVAPFLSHTAQFLRQPSSVKRSWDSFNILLVLFAVICGIFGRRTAAGNDESSSPLADASQQHSGPHVSYNQRQLSSLPNSRWFDRSERKPYDSPIGVPGTCLPRLRRNSSSYPDLRQDPFWESNPISSMFYDDCRVNFYRSPARDQHLHFPRRREPDEEEANVKVIPVDTFVVRRPASAPNSPDRLVPPPRNVKRKRSFHSVPQRREVEERVDNGEAEANRNQQPPPAPPPPPPPPPQLPPAASFHRSPQKQEKIQRKKSGNPKEIATAIASFYNQRKRKKKYRTRNTYEDAADPTLSEQSRVVPPPPPPTPPPPPPSEVFQNLFKKATKSRRVYSIPTTMPPPPPPPPPPNSIFNNLFKKSGGKSKRFHSSSVPPPPPPPLPSTILDSLFKNGIGKSKRHNSVSKTSTPPPPTSPPPIVPTQSTNSSKRSDIPPQKPECPQRRAASTGKPPLPSRSIGCHDSVENLNSGAQSPLIPRPPPPPPFRVPEMKFAPYGEDFVRVRSGRSSRCSSPDLEEMEVMSTRSSEVTDGEASIGPSVSCPSPDVNIKADTFIARLRDEWRLEKVNSWRERHKLGQAHTQNSPRLLAQF